MTYSTRPAKAVAALVCAACMFTEPASARGPMRRHPNAATSRLASNLAHSDRDLRFSFFPISIPGAVASVAIRITNAGLVSGIYENAAEEQITFLWYRGAVLGQISQPGIPVTSLVITDSGMLYGNWGTYTQQTAGFYNPFTQRYTALPDIAGKNLNIGWAANALGVALGQACEGNFRTPVNCLTWIWRGRGYEFFSVPGATATVPNGINERGQVVGYWPDTPPFQAFLFDRGAISPITVGHQPFAAARDITNSGEILLQAPNPQDPAGDWVPFLLSRGSSQALPVFTGSGAVYTEYLGLNERGDLAGLFVAVDAGGNSSVNPVVALRK